MLSDYLEFLSSWMRTCDIPLTTSRTLPSTVTDIMPVTQRYNLNPNPSIRQFIKSYAPDWIISAALWATLWFINNHVSGFKRQFSLSDMSLRYPHAVDQRVGVRQGEHGQNNFTNNVSDNSS
ncbi:hypothetical protein K503DRAFT_522778 [Rhizopogon vinicolor AM-OR11-026]|uniref:Uncharacterized protein n=1 Tax=Rhizopogon vinicolor AM-OR11-026 TaxID=1314800 RepID=A0A1B7MLJ5_9AGAM|nr:hypothetical protein K503DRAFT_522778 [Rhizopogon vinicolor AM-OR11-026]